MSLLDTAKGILKFVIFLFRIRKVKERVEHDFKVFGLSYLRLYGAYLGDHTTTAWLNTYGRSILGFFYGGRLGWFRERTLIQLSAKVISAIYRSKSFTPCNSLDMEVFLRDLQGEDGGPLRKMAQDIAGYFTADVAPVAENRRDILAYCRYPNGLVSWYMYSALPIMYRNPATSQDVLGIFKELLGGEKPSRIAQYVALKALSVLLLHQRCGDKDLHELFTTGCEAFLADGGWIDYPLPARHQPAVAEYVSSNILNFHKHGCTLFADYNEQGKQAIQPYFMRSGGDIVTVRYDSDILDLYLRYCLEVARQNHLAYAVQIFAGARENGGEQALFVLSKVCKLVAEFPAQVLITFKESLGHPGPGSDQPFLLRRDGIAAGGPAMVAPVLLTRKALAAVEAREWAMYSIFINSLEKMDRTYPQVLGERLEDDGDLYLEKTDPYFGERIYQHFFKHDAGIRVAFGAAIAASARADTVEDFFREYSRTFAAHFKGILFPDQGPPRLKSLLSGLSDAGS